MTKDELREYKRNWEKDKGRSPEAKSRQREYDRARNKLPHRKGNSTKWRRANKQAYADWHRTYRLKLRLLVLGHYSNGTMVCACCNETEVCFLSIDHINGGGCAHRKAIGGGGSTYAWLKKNKFPSGFQVLCHNCNLAKGFYGRCPHRTYVKEQ